MKLSILLACLAVFAIATADQTSGRDTNLPLADLSKDNSDHYNSQYPSSQDGRRRRCARSANQDQTAEETHRRKWGYHRVGYGGYNRRAYGVYYRRPAYATYPSYSYQRYPYVPYAQYPVTPTYGYQSGNNVNRYTPSAVTYYSYGDSNGGGGDTGGNEDVGGGDDGGGYSGGC